MLVNPFIASVEPNLMDRFFVPKKLLNWGLPFAKIKLLFEVELSSMVKEEPGKVVELSSSIFQ